MDFLKTITVYLFYLTICSAAKAHPVEIITPTNGTKIIGNKIVEAITEHAQRKGRENPTDNLKPTIETKPLILDPRSQAKVQLATSNPKSMPIPINLLLGSKPRAMPPNIPLVIKNANVQPAPAHYVRLKADTERKNKIKPKLEINLNMNKPLPNIKVIPKDRFAPKSILNYYALKNNNEKHIPRNKFKNVDFYEDDTNIEPLPPATNPAVTKKPKKLENDKDSTKGPELEHHHSKQNTCDSETESGHDNEMVEIINGTHLIRITKLSPEEVQHDTNQRHSKKKYDHDNVFYANPLPIALGGPPKHLKHKKEDGVELVTEQAPSNVEPIDEGSPGIITITNHNYEEVEERSGVYPENNINEDSDQPWTPPPWQSSGKKTHNYYLQNLQKAYDQYLKYVAENNPASYKKANSYPRLDAPELNFMNDLENPKPPPYSPPIETQTVQDVYFGQKPDFNVIDIRPENSLGRIWRTWKDTEIKINKPNALLNKALELGRNLNNLNDVNFGEYGKASNLYGAPAIGLNGYYDNLNNPLTYQYNSYPTYRYML